MQFEVPIMNAGNPGSMTRLLPGARVWIDQDCQTSDKVQLNSGTLAAESSPGQVYKAGAVVPVSNWKNLDSNDAELLMAASRHDDVDNITICKIPSSQYQGFIELKPLVAKCRTREELLSVFPWDMSNALVKGFTAFLREISEKKASGEIPAQFPGGINIRPPGMTTTSVNNQTGLITGLHCDSWSSLPLDKRAGWGNRICANIGAEDRFFLFMNLPIHQIFYLVQPRLRLSPEKASTTQVFNLFCQSFSNYPVVRVRLSPGEAYIAPTDLLVHDGSSVDMSVPDVTLQLRGNFVLQA